MKRLKYVLLTLVLSLIGINNVFAIEVNVTAQYDSKEVPKGSETLVMVNVQSSAKLTNCKFKLTSDAEVELVSKNSANGWNIVEENGAYGFVMQPVEMEGSDVSAGLNILSLKYKVNDSGVVTIEPIQCVKWDNEEDDDKEIPSVNISFTAIEPIEDTTLKNISITNGSMSPSELVAGRLKYIVNLSSPNFGLELTATDEKYQSDIKVKKEDGTEISDFTNITYNDPSGKGQMLLYVIVGGKTTYELDFIYEQKKYDNSLEWVSINNEKINLESCSSNGNNIYCEYTVGSDVDSVIVAAVVKDTDNFELDTKAGNAPGTFPITDFVSALIVVKPKDATIGAKAVPYEIKIIKEGSPEPDDKPSTPPSNNNVNNNPGTSDMPMLLMALILVISLIGSVVLYRKNLENYK